MLKACLFDLDGTLINSEEYYQHGTYFWINRMGIKINKEDIFPIIGKDAKDTYRILSKITGLDEETCKENNDHYFLKEDPLDFRKYLFEDVYDTFQMIKDKGLKIAICSMSPYDYIKKCIEECELEEFVDYYISGIDCEHNKPSPDIYLNALKELNINADEALVIEDAQSGIEAGKAAGMIVVARDDSRFKINQKDADFILEDLRKLSIIVDEEKLWKK